MEVDSTMLEAIAAMEGIVHRDTGRGLRQTLLGASGKTGGDVPLPSRGLRISWNASWWRLKHIYFGRDLLPESRPRSVNASVNVFERPTGFPAMGTSKICGVFANQRPTRSQPGFSSDF